jgi:hypothetical protein|tara:strand:- start:1520 stop:3229 length:1710 start_codon:yes stop_codon:yes gene_type:complete
MAIKILEDFYAKEIALDKGFRNYLAEHYIHKVSIRFDHQINLLEKRVEEGLSNFKNYEEYNGMNLYQAIVSTLGSQQEFKDKVISGAVKQMFGDASEVRRYIRKEIYSGGATKEVKDKQAGAYTVKSFDIQVIPGQKVVCTAKGSYFWNQTLKAKGIDKDGNKIVQTDPTQRKSIFHAAVRNMLRACLGSAGSKVKSNVYKMIEAICKTHQIDIESFSDKEGKKMSDAGTSGKIKTGIDSIITHGSQEQIQKSTAARFQLGKSWKGMKKRMDQALKDGVAKEQIPFAEKMAEETRKALWVEYRIADITKAKGMMLDQTTIIECEVNGDQGDARHFDVDGIKETANKSLEKQAKDILRKLEQKKGKLPDLKGSPTKKVIMRRMAQKVLVKELLKVKQPANPDMRFKVNKALLQEAKDIQKSQKGSKRNKQRAQKRKKARKLGNVAGATLGTVRARGRGKVEQQAGSNPLALKELLNEVLPQEVARRMGSPALNYRTGRFANSAEVTDVLVGPKGGLQSIDYTYRRNPYETFEPGGKQGSIQRDPRKLIGGTIRELAMGIMQRKFIPTRRV